MAGPDNRMNIIIFSSLFMECLVTSFASDRWFLKILYDSTRQCERCLLEVFGDNRTREHFVLNTLCGKLQIRATKVCEHEHRDSVALTAAGILLGCVSTWIGVGFHLYLRFRLSSTGLRPPSAGCTRGGGSRSCPIRPSTLRCS